MNETIERVRDVLVARMDVLEEEVRLAEAKYREREGDFHYVVLQNVALMERLIGNIEKLKLEFRTMDLERFESIDAFKEVVLGRLQELYDARAFIRPAVRMVMECIRSM